MDNYFVRQVGFVSVVPHNGPMNTTELTEESHNYLMTVLRRAWYEAKEDDEELDLIENLMRELGLMV